MTVLFYQWVCSKAHFWVKPYTFDVTLEEGVQILHSGNHWLTISTVRVYDSLHQTLPHSIKMQDAALLNTKDEKIVVHYANVQQQKNFSDCGLFAIAFAMSICNE